MQEQKSEHTKQLVTLVELRDDEFRMSVSQSMILIANLSPAVATLIRVICCLRFLLKSVASNPLKL